MTNYKWLEWTNQRDMLLDSWTEALLKKLIWKGRLIVGNHLLATMCTPAVR